MTAVVVSGVLVALAFVVWPAGARVARASDVLEAVPARAPRPSGPGPEGRGLAVGEEGTRFAVGAGDKGNAGDAGDPGGIAEMLRELWRADPVELIRTWRQARQRTRSVTAGVLALLEGIAPALEAGLPPAVAVRLSGSSVGTGRDAQTELLVAELAEACELGGPIAPVWRAWAASTGSPDLSFVAAAWQLTELTGAPLADAVQRAVVSVREARERTRRVHVAVAGPRATVVVLTVLPLTGPAFGLACGVPPSELYLASPVSAAAAFVGVVLIWVGRLWCRRLVESATRAGGDGDSWLGMPA
ncbi:type II secretion system F family protein [Intrasporangium sp.]|uniref:type II secretion system F family protein n=1 Tax=Intrasporangium sp. TaxID=1925024 RepID=UPI00293B722F|nr:type II secretion system F family protein [Intrasporangium sp.]MDV3222651.1 type II secretion system F family protein [Intrasporangium sp.]